MIPLRALLPQSLVARVFALYTATLLLFVGGGLGVFFAQQFESEIDDASVSASMLVEVMAQTVSDSAVIGDYDTIKRTLQMSIARSSFAEASFIDLRGGVVRAKADAREDAGVPRWLAARVEARLPEMNRTISVGGRDYGVLRLQFATDVIAGNFWRVARMALALGAASLLGGLIVIWVPLRRWLGNLDRLRAFEQEVQAGTLDPRKFLQEDAPLEIRRTFELLGRTASSLQSEREQASVTLAAIGEGVLSTDAAGTVVYANLAASEALELPQADLVGRDVRTLLPGGFGADNALQSWRSRRTRISAAGGRRRVVDTTLSSIAGHDREVVGYVLAVRDVTESHQLEERLREELAARQGALVSLRGLLEGLLPGDRRAAYAGSDDIGVVSALVAELVGEREAGRRALANQKFALDQHAIVSVTDRDGKLIYANDRFCEVLGYPREEVLGKRHSAVKSGIHGAEIYRDLWRTIAGGQVWQGELCNRTRDGRLRWFSSTIVPLAGPDGRPEEYIGISADISALKEAQAALSRAKDAAEAANRAKSDFLANMSHEIRTPMNGIIGMASLALDTPLDDEQREYVGIVKSSAEALLTIINDILDFSKVEAGKLVVESVPFDVRRAIGEAMRSLELPAREKGLLLVTRIDEDLPAELVGDSGRLRQVLVNLVGNAIKFTQHGRVEVEARVLAGAGEMATLEVAVRDTGIGIAPDKLGHIFDAFTQEDTSITRRYGGTGLGLTICKRLVELMGGRIRVESEAGRGSTFTFAVSMRRVSAAMPGEGAARAFQGRRVLVVDDNADNRQVLGRLMGGWGLAVEEADSPDQALARLLAGPRVDCLVLDADMPVTSGVQLASALAQPAYEKVRAPVILLARPGLAPRAPEGVRQVLETPVSPADLLEALHGAMKSPAAGPSPGLRVLLVEDNVINEKVAVALLGKRGCRVSVAHDGQQALEACERESFDVVLMDMQMPVMDGLEASRRLRRRERETGRARLPVLAMTANAMQEDREACLEAGMDDFLAKPIRPDELFSHLQQLTRAALAA